MKNSSEHPAWEKGEPCILGIDEAGRGPVLGPMVYSAAFCPMSRIADLNALGADDSKQMSEAQRDNLRSKIDAAPFLRSVTRTLSAHQLSIRMLRRVKHNLNFISHEAALSLVQQAIDEGANIAEVYVDTVGPPDAYAQKFWEAFPHLKKVVVEKKADATYRIVGAASIIAKTTRDGVIRHWIFPEEQRSSAFPRDDANSPVMYPEERGSGYPSDPTTKKWLENSFDRIFGFPTIVRFSWGTTKVFLEKKAVQVDWESDDDDEGVSAIKPKVKTHDIKSFFGKKDAARPKKQRKTLKSPVPRMLQSMSLLRVSKLF